MKSPSLIRRPEKSSSSLGIVVYGYANDLAADRLIFRIVELADVRMLQGFLCAERNEGDHSTHAPSEGRYVVDRFPASATRETRTGSTLGKKCHPSIQPRDTLTRRAASGDHTKRVCHYDLRSARRKCPSDKKTVYTIRVSSAKIWAGPRYYET